MYKLIEKKKINKLLDKEKNYKNEIKRFHECKQCGKTKMGSAGLVGINKGRHAILGGIKLP